MESMQNLKIDNLLGVWKSDDYILTILPTRIVLSGNSTRGIDENIIMNYIADNNEYHNTIQVSDSINLFQLLTDNEIVLKLKNINGQNNLVSEVFNRVGFENEFSFYQILKLQINIMQLDGITLGNIQYYLKFVTILSQK